MSQIINRPENGDWVRQAFLLPEKAISDADMVRRTLTTAAFKFTDTTIGGNFAINTPPQYTRYADIKVGGQPNAVFKRSTGNLERSPDDGTSAAHASGARTRYRASSSRGMGRYYSEAIDDNGQYVTMRFGVPEFNSLWTFFGNFYHSGAATLARTGRGKSVLYMVGEAAGIALSLPFWPAIQAGRLIKFFTQSPPSKFYYLKPAMPLYWKAVTTILNQISVNMGFTHQSMRPEQAKMYANPEDVTYNDAVAKKYHDWLPDIINEHGVIDAFAVATRAQRLSNRYNEVIRDQVSGGRWEQIQTKIGQWLEQEIAPGNAKYGNVDAYVKAYADLPANQPQSSSGETGSNDAMPPAETVGNREKYTEGSPFMEFFEGERRDGASFVTFRVDYTNTADESFSNSTREADIASQINSMSNSNRSIRFSIADGNFGDGAFANLVESTIGGVKDVVAGLADRVGVSGLAALGGSALVDIPKMWDASTANLPRMDFTIQLRSPYGNKMSRMRNLFLPLSMILAGALPLSAGRHAFTSPFICEAYCRGRAGIRLGMVESVSVTRGTGNLGWNQDDEPLGIDVRLTIVDMSSILHMPISMQFSALDGAIAAAGEAVAGDTGAYVASLVTETAFDEDNSFTDYLSVLASLSFQDMVYPTNRWRINVANQMASFDSWRSPARWANWFMGTFPGRVLNAVSENTDRPR
jgi:hypothetical protein